MGRARTLMFACLAIGPVNAATYTVTTTNDSGAGSLRWAIDQANGRSGKDWVLFDPSLSGAAIEPTTSLPTVTDPQTIINGDINSDGAPDIALHGANAGTASGLTIRADDCSVAGLAVTGFAQYGILVRGATGCVIVRCHVGVDLAGTTAVRNGWDQIHLRSSSNTMIGGTGIGGRNIIAAGSTTPLRSGIYLKYGSGNRIRNNNIGIARDGKTRLTSPGDSGVGITLDGMVRITPTESDGETRAPAFRTRFNTIGGVAAECNVFGGMKVGLDLRNAYKNHVRGNYFGLARNGTTRVGIADCSIRVRNGSKNNWIMGLYDAPETRNVISGSVIGVLFKDGGTQDNYLMRNYFGTTAAAGAQRPLGTAVVCHHNAGPQSITHNTIMGGHVEKWGAGGISLSGAGGGSYIARNEFGIYEWPGQMVKPMKTGVNLEGADAELVSNHFHQTENAILCTGTSASCLIVRNKFRNCYVAVWISGLSEANLGNLGNRPTTDDGDNQFYHTNKWFIWNTTSNRIKAEGNHFPVPWPPDVHKRIVDKQDKPSYGTVDILPLGGGLPAAGMEGMLGLSGTAAVPTAGGGAEIVFSLSVPADVTATVLNIAGRPVRTICETKDCEAGTNTLLWNGQGNNGLPVPNGRYLIRITAQNGAGQSATALTALRLDR